MAVVTFSALDDVVKKAETRGPPYRYARNGGVTTIRPEKTRSTHGQREAVRKDRGGVKPF